ncbi:MAG: hypothetical protein ACQEP6_02420, partial [Patescibacteria group bacterium]
TTLRTEENTQKIQECLQTPEAEVAMKKVVSEIREMQMKFDTACQVTAEQLKKPICAIGR